MDKWTDISNILFKNGHNILHVIGIYHMVFDKKSLDPYSQEVVLKLYLAHVTILFD
jgi:hypothetical protein